ncbi:MAG: nucleotidyltransferase family protein [Anaerolineae bacterium]
MSTASEVRSKHISLLLALASKNTELLEAWLKTYTFEVNDLRWLGQQGISPFAYFCFQQSDLLQQLPPAIALQWDHFYQQTTVAIAATDWEIEQLLSRLSRANIDFLWVKGGALACTIYPNPACRVRGDLDLWIQPEQLEPAVAALQQSGYTIRKNVDRPLSFVRLTGGEQQLYHQQAAVHLIELQWPVIRGEWIRRTTRVDHAAMWQRRSSVMLGQQPFSTTAPEDTLIHLCVHQAINHQFQTPALRNLLDIHLLAVSGALNWSLVAERAQAWRLKTVVWTVLDLARQLFATPVPAMVIQDVQPPLLQQQIIKKLALQKIILRAETASYSFKRFLIQFTMIDRPADAVYLIWRSIYPEADWLNALYPDESTNIKTLRIKHLKTLFTSSQA